MIIAVSGKIGSGKDTVGVIIQYLVCKANNRLAEHQMDFTEFRLAPIMNAEQSGWYIKKFAEKIKIITCLVLGCTRAQLEDQKFKNTPLDKSWDKWEVYNPTSPHAYSKFFTSEQEALNHIQEFPKETWSVQMRVREVNMTPRLFMQLIGTEGGRDLIHPNIWVNALMSDYKPHTQSRDGYPNWVVTDTRFPNELERLEKHGFSIRVSRENPLIKSGGGGDPAAEDYIRMKMSQQAQPEHSSETALDSAQFDYYIDNSGTLDELVEKVREILIKENIIS